MKKRIKERLTEQLGLAKDEMNATGLDFFTNYYLSDIKCFYDSVSDFAGGYVDIYYSDLKNALGDSDIMDYMQEAISSGFVDTNNYDFYKHIQAAEYLYYENEVYNCIEAISFALVCEYILEKYSDKDITDDMLDRIFELDYNKNDNLQSEVDAILSE